MSGMINRRRFVGLAGCAMTTRVWAQPLPNGNAGMQPSVMLWTLKDRGTLKQNLGAVARAGYRHVELVDEWKSWSSAEWTAMLAQMSDLGITVDAISAMGLGFATPGGAEPYAAGLREIVPIAKRLGAGQVILLSGPMVEGAAGDMQFRAAVETLKRAGEVLAAAGLVGVIEPIDRLEQPKIYLDGVTEAFRMVREVGSPAVKVLYDLYHEQRTHGNLLEKLENNIKDVGLIHVADVPGRHQPGTGELDFAAMYKVLAKAGYSGVVAMEFYPVGDVVEVLRRARLELEAAASGH